MPITQSLRSSTHRNRNYVSLLSVAWVLALAAPAIADTSDANPAAQSAASQVFHPGDRLKLKFYERLDTDETRWRNAGGAAVEVPREFHERTELSGDYVIQADGSISLPLLGRFSTASQSEDSIVLSLQKATTDLLDRKSFVNLLSIEHRPIYVVGPVKNPGAYQFEPGITPLHIVALAGGLSEAANESWRRVEATRELEQLQASLVKVKRMLTAVTVLKAERDGGSPLVPDVAKLVGQSDFATYLAEDLSQRGLVEADRSVQAAANVELLCDSQSEAAARDRRLDPINGEITLGAARVAVLQKQAAKYASARPTLLDAQSALLDIRDRGAQAILDIQMAQQKVSASEFQRANAKFQANAELARAIAAATQDGGQAVLESEGELNVIKTMETVQGSGGDDASIAYEIIRMGPDGPSSIQGSERTVLEPGDLVRIAPHQNKETGRDLADN